MAHASESVTFPGTHLTKILYNFREKEYCIVYWNTMGFSRKKSNPPVEDINGKILGVGRVK